VVQNNLCALALLSAAEMEDESGDTVSAKQWRNDAGTIFRNLEKYLVANDGTWIWCVDPDLKLNEAVLQKAVNRGFGGLNGVACMSADVLGFQPADWPRQEVISHSQKTFEKLYNFPLRKTQFDKYGFWSQFDAIHDGTLTSPSYGQGYALQTMLLFNKLDMAGRALDFLAQATCDAPGISFNPPRLSPYYFYERVYSPDAAGSDLAVGCGPLNLVNVAEPLKAARLIAGMDDTSLKQVSIIPRVPPNWQGCSAENWPIRTSTGVVRADFSFERTNGKEAFRLTVRNGKVIPKLAVLLPAGNKTVSKSYDHVTQVNIDRPVGSQ
jgi:hypothetical protein